MRETRGREGGGFRKENTRRHNTTTTTLAHATLAYSTGTQHWQLMGCCVTNNHTPESRMRRSWAGYFVEMQVLRVKRLRLCEEMV